MKQITETWREAMDKQHIARLVAEKVWGWQQVSLYGCCGLYWCGDKTSSGRKIYDNYFAIEKEVFSWSGFGRTVERMIGGFKINIHEIDMPKSFGVQFTRRSDIVHGYSNRPKEDGIVLTTHLAALDALGVEWRNDEKAEQV